MDTENIVYFFTLDAPQRNIYAVYLLLLITPVIAAPLIRTVIHAVGDKNV